MIEADEGDKEATPASPLSTLSTRSEDDSNSSSETPKKKRKLSEKSVVSQTTSKDASVDPVVGKATTLLVAAWLARAIAASRSPSVELTEAARLANVCALMKPSNVREPDEFLLSNNFEVRMEEVFDESLMNMSDVSLTGNAKSLMPMLPLTHQGRTNDESPKKSTSKTEMTVKPGTEPRTDEARSEASAHWRPETSQGNAK